MVGRIEITGLDFIENISKRLPDEGYFRNASCTLNLISTFLLG
jgi:hypothetical protein